VDKLCLVFILLVVYEFKHHLADFTLQGKYMLGKFKSGWDFVPPLALHCTVHALFTYFIMHWTLLVLGVAQGNFPIQMSLIDFAIHFVMDRIKASPRLLGRFKYICMHDLEHRANMTEERWRGKEISNKLFWESLGIDQSVHRLTHYYLIWRLIDYV